MTSHQQDWPSPHVSHSQVSTYVTCPERYRQRYVLGRTPAHRSGEQVFGNAIHAALAVYHLHLRETAERLPIDVVQHEFDSLFAVAQDGPVQILWADADSPEKMIEQGHELLRLYIEEATVLRVLDVERSFVVTPDQLPSAFRPCEPVVGIIDLIEIDNSGRIFITELKTSSRRYDEARLRYDLQLSLYAAIATSLGFPTAALRFRVLVRTKVPQLQVVDVVRSPEQLSEAGKLVSEVLRAIDHRIFYPNRSRGCSACPYRSRCGT
jgi:putative RecB family exonuclease